jgi:hypothetical protein
MEHILQGEIPERSIIIASALFDLWGTVMYGAPTRMNSFGVDLLPSFLCSLGGYRRCFVKSLFRRLRIIGRPKIPKKA